MQLSVLPAKKSLVNVWVFDVLVVVELNDGTLTYFEKPMIQGSIQSPLLVNSFSNIELLPNPSTFFSKEIAVAADGTTLEYYGVSKT